MFDITPANTSTAVSNRGGADNTSLRRLALISPELSMTPMPSIATSTVPRGAKPVKLVTMLVKILCSPARLNRLTGAMVAPVAG